MEITNFQELVDLLIANISNLGLAWFGTSTYSFLVGVIVGIGAGLGVVIAWR